MFYDSLHMHTTHKHLAFKRLLSTQYSFYFPPFNLG
jgi:hypothetical protein